MRSNAKTAAAPRHAESAALAAAMVAQVREAVLDALTLGDDDAAAETGTLTVPRAHLPIAPARLANALSGDDAGRAQACQLYERCLTHYRNVVRAEDNPRGVDDVGAAVAAFVAANLSVLQAVVVAPGTLLRLERQLAAVARLSSDWHRAPLGERQAFFEQMALLAVLMSESAAAAAAQGAAAVAHVQSAARAYLLQLLGLDADSLVLGPDGLAARTVRAAAN